MASKRKVRHRSRPATLTAPSQSNEATSTAGVSGNGDHSVAYEVGYKKPPKRTQFKPGRSGNASGRPKGSKNLKTELAEELQERVVVREGGKARRVSKQRAMLKRLTERALQGDARSASLIINMVARFLDQVEDDDTSAPLEQEDLAILKDFEAQIRATNRKETSS